MKKGGAIFAFTLKNAEGETKDWFIDLKESGKVGKGLAPEGKKQTGKPSALSDSWPSSAVECVPREMRGPWY